METSLSPLAQLRVDLETRSPREIAAAALERANSNASRNVFLGMDAKRTLAEAEALPARFPDPARRPLLYGVPVAVKDCFDMTGFPTSCGSRFYAEKNGIAHDDSAVVARLRRMGAVITGKTHMHPLAYGITGENAEYCDCLQPADATLLTGGSSSGSAASVQEGSSIAAIGTDTGGSVRAPAAFCHLAGYRATVGLGDWRGGAHLAESFDTIGWLFRDLRDGPALAAALLDVPTVPAPSHISIGVVEGKFLAECEPAVLDSYRAWQRRLRDAGAKLRPVEPNFWHDAFEIYAGIQASEAAKIHAGNFDRFELGIADRLRWGASLSQETVDALRQRHKIFCSRMDALLDGGFLVLPCAQMGRLIAGADHSNTRQTILRYTTPISLARMPVVTLPGNGGGVQLVAPRGQDAELLAFAAMLPLKPSA